MDLDSEQSSLGSDHSRQQLVIPSYDIIGYKEYQDFLENIDPSATTYIFYTCTNSPTSGYSWCPLCTQVSQIIEKQMNIIQKSVFLTVHVGLQDEWEDNGNPFRTDKNLNLKVIPTFLNYKTAKRLEGGYCLKPHLLALVLEEECQFLN